MRRAIAVLLLVSALLIGLLLSASAHSGNTDSEGGHYNNAAGEYHYHHGRPAHSHPNGACPYEQEDKRVTDGGVWILALVAIGVVLYIFSKK